MNIILAAIHIQESPQALPLANSFLKAYLGTDEELAGAVSVALCDFFLDQDPEDCVDAVMTGMPEAVGFSLYLWNREFCCRMARLIRSLSPQTVLFAGGPEATAAPEGLLKDELLDFVILGEGEETFVQAVGRLRSGQDVAGIPGVAVAGRAAVSVQFPRLLETIPSPYLSGVIDPADYSGVLWQLSRGCGFSCDFCFDHRGAGGIRTFSLERLEAELRLFVKKRVSQIFVLDSTFNNDPKRAKTILRMITKVAPHIHFHFEVRSEFIDAEMARLFAGVTCSLQIGLQSADPKVLKNVGRFLDPDDFSRRIGYLNREGVVFGFDLIYGLPGDTGQGFTGSLDLALQLYPNHLDIFPLAVLPGTRLAEKRSMFGIRHLPSPPYTVTSSDTFTAEAMADCATLAHACDLFYSRGKAVAWFNAVVNALESSPSAFLEQFARWLDGKEGSGPESSFDDAEVWQMQRAFLGTLFLGRKRRLLPLALDLVDYHHYYAEALLAVPPDLPGERELEHLDLLDLPLVLSPSARLAAFNYEIVDILEAGEVDLVEFSGCFLRTPSYAVIYPRNGEVFTESIDRQYFAMLKELDGIRRVRSLATMSGISEVEAGEFLDVAVAEGMVTWHR